MRNITLEERRGRIFDIQKYSIHDGPGIRTIVFLKGCVLRCRWCCNPESQSGDIEHMATEGKPKTVGRDVTAKQVLEEVLQDLPYYRRSGGGLTLSGGECLLQPDFSEALLALAHLSGISTAVESAGFGPFETIREQILPHLDVFLLDIKHMDAAKHEAYTGQANAPLLENALKIAQTGQNLIIRVPVVPGFNDTALEISDIARYAATLPGVQQLHLLPFHRLGENKYTGLGRQYAYADTLPPTAQHMEALQQAAQAAAALQVQIGG